MGGCCTSNYDYIESEIPYYKICIVNPTGDISTIENKNLTEELTNINQTPENSTQNQKKQTSLPFSQRDIKTVINDRNVVLNLWERQSDFLEMDIGDYNTDDMEIHKRYAKYFYYNCDIFV